MMDTKTRWLYDQIINNIIESEKVISTSIAVPDSYTDEEVEKAVDEVYQWIEECSKAGRKDIIECCRQKLDGIAEEALKNEV